MTPHLDISRLRRSTDPGHSRRILGRGAVAGLILAASISAGLAQTTDGASLTCGTPHRVASGETLSAIAGRAYGDPALYGLLLDANSAALKGNPENLVVGMELQIPCRDATATTRTPEMEAAIAEQDTLSTDELDTLFGPVALFPDPVLTPVLVASTFPLDVVKANQFLADNPGLSSAERVDQVAAQPWDESVRTLAAGFPDLLNRMGQNIDWTEQAGEAVVGQTDDVLTSLQRLRGKAQQNGYLADSPTQKVEKVNDKIVIAPADPGVVYVPTYDSQVVYTKPATAPPNYQYGYSYANDDGADWDDMLATGTILLGSAVILDDIFDDDDNWHHWDDDNIDWDRGDLTINRGDRTINRGDRTINIDRERNRVSIGAGDRTQINRAEVNNLRNRAPQARANMAAAGHHPIATPANREAARKKIEARKAAGVKPANLKTHPKAARAAAQHPQAARAAASHRPAAAKVAHSGARISKPAAHKLPKAHAPQRSSAFERHGGAHPSLASHRGRASMGGGHIRRGGRR